MSWCPRWSEEPSSGNLVWNSQWLAIRWSRPESGQTGKKWGATESALSSEMEGRNCSLKHKVQFRTMKHGKASISSLHVEAYEWRLIIYCCSGLHRSGPMADNSADGIWKLSLCWWAVCIITKCKFLDRSLAENLHFFTKNYEKVFTVTAWTWIPELN